MGQWVSQSCHLLNIILNRATYPDNHINNSDPSGISSSMSKLKAVSIEYHAAGAKTEVDGKQ